MEFGSVNTGIPYGWYTYFSQPTLDKELWVAGIPFMSSLSYVFLTFAGLQMARLATEPLGRGSHSRWDLRWKSQSTPLHFKTVILAGLLTMGLDFVIDPVALPGGRWFLGQIYQYNHPGIYFGVPVMNFAGWALTTWLIVGLFWGIDRFSMLARLGAWRDYPHEVLLCVGLFTGILAFNLAVTRVAVAISAIGEFAMVFLVAPGHC